MRQNKERVVHGCVSSEHIVELFDTQKSRSEAVATFVDAGYRDGDTLLVVAKGKNWKTAAQRLERLGCPVERAIGGGHLTVLDAGAVMAQFMRHGRPAPELFDAVVSTLVAKLASRGGGLRIYGEMVDVLAEERNFAAARELEGLWNDLSARVSVTLLCGYASAHFADPSTAASLRAICECHTRVQKSAPDTLSGWVLSSLRGDRAVERDLGTSTPGGGWTFYPECFES